MASYSINGFAWPAQHSTAPHVHPLLSSFLSPLLLGVNAGIPQALNLRALNYRGQGQEHAGGHDGQHGVEVGGGHVLPHVHAHRPLGEDRSGGGGQVGAHCSSEGGPLPIWFPRGD